MIDSPFAPGTQPQVQIAPRPDTRLAARGIGGVAGRAPVQIALNYAAQGMSIIPVKRAQVKADRIPLVKWSIYQTQRPTADDLRAWWASWPTANPIIVTGAISGIIALDVDGPEGLTWLESQGLPATLTVSRGAPGRYHFWFKHPGFKVSCKTLHPQVEVKGDGGLIPCPGALHWTGAPYRVVKALDIANCPAWLIDLLRPVEHKAPAYQPGPDDDQLIPLAVDALSAARSVNREDWLTVGMALHSAGEGYRALWHTFSARCPEKYNPHICDQTWNSFKGSGIGLGTLFYIADQDNPGWRPKSDRWPSAPVKTSPTGEAAPLANIQNWPDVLPVGVISAALLCGSAQIALALIASARDYQPGDVIEPSDLVGQVGKAFVHRSLMDQGAVQFVAKLPVENLSSIENSGEDSQGKSATNTTGRRSARFTLRPWSAILTDLDRALPDHLLRLYFPSEGEHSLLPSHQLDRLVLDDDQEALDLLKAAAAKQDERETRRSVKLWREAVTTCRARLRNPERVTIPAEWHNVVELRRYLVRAVHEADPKPRDYAEWSLLAGVNHRSIGALLTGAGLQNEPQTLEIEVNPADPIRSAKKAAYQVGKIGGFVVTQLDGKRRAVFEPLDQVEETLAREVQPGCTVAALLRTKSKQTVVGEVRGMVRRDRPAVQPNEPTAQKPAGQVVAKSIIPRLALPVFAQYQRDCLILAHERLTGAPVDKGLRNALTPREAQCILTGAYRLADERLIDGATGEILRDFRPVAQGGENKSPEGSRMAYTDLMDEVIEEPEPTPVTPVVVKRTIRPIFPSDRPNAPTADEIDARQKARGLTFTLFGDGKRADALAGMSPVAAVGA